MKKILSVILTCCLLVTSLAGVTALADDRPDTDIAVNLNGEYMNFDDVDPIIVNGRTMVPFRAVFEALGCEVSWNEQTRTATGTRDGEVIKLPVGNQLAKVNGDAVYLDQPAVIADGRTLVPLRFVAESLGAQVSWDDGTRTVYILADVSEKGDNYFFTGASFTDTGTWGFEASTGGAFPEGALKGGSNETPENTQPAVLTFNAKTAGEYYVWVRSRDYPNDRPGIRTFNVEVNGTDVGVFGNHGKEGYAWAKGNNVTLNEGANELKLIDSADYYGRCDGILITNNPDLVPSEDYNELLEVVTPYKAGSDVDTEITFPSYALEQAEPTETAVLENETTRVTFYAVPTSGGTVIQNEIAVKDGDTWVVTKYRDEDFGYLIVGADTAKKVDPIREALAFNTTFLVGAKYSAYYGTNIYSAGLGSWAIPSAMTSDGTSVTLTASCDMADVQAVWTLDGAQPKVTVTATYKADGAYSIGVFEGREIPYDQLSGVNAADAVTNPADVRPDPGILLGASSLSSPTGTYTLTEQNLYTPGRRVVKGVAGDGSGSWAIGLRGPDCNYRASLFSPVLGEADSVVAAGGTQSVTYHVISTLE